MKKIIFYFACLLTGFSTTSFAQVFHVMNVKGTVTHVKSNKGLASGMEVDAKDELKFAAQDAKVLVANEKTGRQLLDANKSKKNSKGEFISFLSDLLIPSASSLQMSSRGAEDAEIKNFKDYLGTDTYVILGNELTLNVAPNVYPLSETKFIACIYKSNNQTAKKKLIQNGKSITFSKDELYKYRGVVMDMEAAEKMTLYYYDSETQASAELTSVKVLFLDDDMLKAELKGIIAYYKGLNYAQEKVKTEVYKYILEAYGRTDRLDFDKWLKSSGLSL